MKKTCYTCFDGDKDILYYRLMTAWDKNSNIDFVFNNAHFITQSRDSSTETTIKNSLRKRLLMSDVFMVLVGESTKYLYKFVRWEIELALELNLPIIVINLNGKVQKDVNLCPPILNNKLTVHIPFKLKAIEYAINNWPSFHYKLSKQGVTSSYSYPKSLFENS